MRFERPAKPVPQIAFAGCAVIHGRVLPERTQLVDDRYPLCPGDLQGGKSVETWRMRMDQIDLLPANQFADPRDERPYGVPLVQHRERAQSARKSAMKKQALHRFLGLGGAVVLRRSQMNRFPTEAALRPDDRER